MNRASLVWFKKSLVIPDLDPLYKASQDSRVLRVYVYRNEMIKKNDHWSCYFDPLQKSQQNIDEQIFMESITSANSTTSKTRYAARYQRGLQRMILSL